MRLNLHAFWAQPIHPTSARLADLLSKLHPSLSRKILFLVLEALNLADLVPQISPALSGISPK